MPCRDYPSDSWGDNSHSTWEYNRLKERADMLARIACKAMAELERQGTGDFLLLGDEEVRKWWEQHKIDDAKAAAERKEKARIAKIKREALAKLTEEERQLLGIKVTKVMKK